MKSVLEALLRLGGARMAALVMKDGVPVACEGGDPALSPEALGALAAALMADMERAGASMSLPAPRRAVLRASRGSAVVQSFEHGLLVVLLDAGAPLEQLRPALDAAVARLARRAPRPEEPSPALPRRATRSVEEPSK